MFQQKNSLKSFWPDPGSSLAHTTDDRTILHLKHAMKCSPMTGPLLSVGLQHKSHEKKSLMAAGFDPLTF